MDTLPLVAPEQVGLSATRLDRVRKWMHRWVDSGRLAGMVTVVMRKGELAFAETVGKADVERNRPMRPDTIFRIYSMTKPLTSTAIMMLYEEGHFQLDDPISKFIPAFANPRVYAGGSRGKIDSVPAEREITFRDLLTHTSGLTYGFMESNPVDALYRAKTNGVDFQTGDTSLKDIVERLGTFPLIAQGARGWFAGRMFGLKTRRLTTALRGEYRVDVDFSYTWTDGLDLLTGEDQGRVKVSIVG